MPLDHYVSQVHLRNFYSPVLQNRLHAVRKSDLKAFTPRSEDVCRIADGSSTPYLQPERVVEDFLLSVEPRYNAALTTLRDGEPDATAVHTMAGFAAYVSTCAPAAIRIGTAPLQSVLQATAEMLDRQGRIPPAPEALGNKTITQLLNDGTIHFDVDGKYPQALGISGILYRLSVFGNSPWEILHNETPDNPFLTSDFPVAIEARGDSGVVNRIVPLAPDLAIRILPDIARARTKPDLTFSGFRYRKLRLDRADVSALNRLIVQCAEDLVFHRDAHAWIPAFVSKNRRYRIECVTTRVPYGAGIMNIATQRVIATGQVA